MSPLAACRMSIALLAVAGITACSRSQSQPKIPLGHPTTSASSARDALPEAARVALDLGNNEFRAGNYDKAMAAYRDAAKVVPDNAAPYFGIYMTAKKLGDTALADSATAAIAARNGATLMLSDSGMKALHATQQANAAAAPK